MHRRPWWRAIVELAAVVAIVMLSVAGCANNTGKSQVEGPSRVLPTAPGTGARPAPHSAGTVDPMPAPREVELAVDKRRSHADVASGGPHAPYNYAPTVMDDNGLYRMWWCSQLPNFGPAGDDILYATSRSLDGPFAGAGGTGATGVFHGSKNGFDAMHTCDPSVLRVGATYYLYYTGSTGNRDHGNSIGVATSTDGVHFQRANNGRPIVTPSEDTRRANGYGVGQPSALFLDGWYYLMFTDTTGKAAGWNGAGQFVIRASDPLFHNNVQALAASGFQSVPSTVAVRKRAVVDAFSSDWMWVDALNAFAVAHETSAGTTITFWNKDFTRNPYHPVEITGAWQEGPGLVRDADGHAPASASDPCGRVPVDVVRATRDASSPTGLSHFGLDVYGINGCRNSEAALRLLTGYAMPSPARTMDIVAGGKLVAVDRRSVAQQLAKKVLDMPVAALADVEPVARLTPGLPALWVAGRPLALLLPGGQICPIGSNAVAKANSSPIVSVTTKQWDSHPVVVDLSSLRE